DPTSAGVGDNESCCSDLANRTIRTRFVTMGQYLDRAVAVLRSGTDVEASLARPFVDAGRWGHSRILDQLSTIRSRLAAGSPPVRCRPKQSTPDVDYGCGGLELGNARAGDRIVICLETSSVDEISLPVLLHEFIHYTGV